MFEFLGWKLYDKMNFATNYSHKLERRVTSIDGRARPEQLYPYYSWVHRYCLEAHCIEQLVAIYDNANITIHTVQFEKYRIKPMFESKSRTRKCSL